MSACYYFISPLFTLLVFFLHISLYEVHENSYFILRWYGGGAGCHIKFANIRQNAEFTNLVTKSIFLGRGKHGRMTSLFVFATLAMGMVVAPMAFKLIVLLGGKVLLLAMLIMILTGAQGLKKVATGNLNYGLYQTHAHNPCKFNIQFESFYT